MTQEPSTYQNTCLNQNLFEGADFVIKSGILMRLRKGKIAVASDIQQIFH